MIVADARAIAEVLLARPPAAAIRRAITPHSELHVPEHFHVELLSILGRYSMRAELDGDRAVEALSALNDLRVIRYPVIELAGAMWALRSQLTAYDTAYLALAQRLRVGLLTLDQGLAEAAARTGRLVLL